MHFWVADGQLVQNGEVSLAINGSGVHLLESVLKKRPGLVERRLKEQRRRQVEAQIADAEYEEVYAFSKGDQQRRRKAKKKKRKLNTQRGQCGKASRPSSGVP